MAPKMVRILITIDAETLARLDELVMHYGSSRSEEIREAVIEKAARLADKMGTVEQAKVGVS